VRPPLLLLQFTMREVQGGIIGSGLIVMMIGVTGVIKPVLRAISPITVAANIGVLVSHVADMHTAMTYMLALPFEATLSYK
jgi:predicted benzoate:H+ symporter BenE